MTSVWMTVPSSVKVKHAQTSSRPQRAAWLICREHLDSKSRERRPVLEYTLISSVGNLAVKADLQSHTACYRHQYSSNDLVYALTYAYCYPAHHVHLPVCQTISNTDAIQ